ncbi:MAG: indolepyruvate ferredoxin oxidoreductase subunit alpha, partial [Actinobacteria bacterium]|nr:indolepyruvate ferredoxin oxidoreductase subunit alpha [Actinomycetota bacterium]
KYQKDSQKYVMIPAYARARHAAVLQRWEKLKAYCEGKVNYMFSKPRGRNSLDDIGIITSGVSYQYAREIFYNLPILKLNMTNPLPAGAIKSFTDGKRLVLVIEELEPYLEEQVRLINPQAHIAGQEYFPDFGELNLQIMEDVYDILFGSEPSDGSRTGAQSGDVIMHKTPDNNLADLPARPPVLCAGCPHRSVFLILKKLKVAVMGDIGCYTLSVLPPLNTLDSTLCMGAGVGQALGMEKADPGLRNRVVSVIGDSTFFHSGVTPMIDNAYNGGTGLIIVLDNGTTAMTGHQAHPGTGKTLMGLDVPDLKPEAFAAAAGIKNIRVVDPYDMKKLEEVFKEELEKKELSFVVCRRICILLEKDKKTENVFIDQHLCKQCGICLKFGCPAIELREGLYKINNILCTGCEVCFDTCKWKAIQSIR